jgi:hypothetical protein
LTLHWLWKLAQNAMGIADKDQRLDALSVHSYKYARFSIVRQGASAHQMGS